MKIKRVESLSIPEVKVISFERFKDFRRYIEWIKEELQNQNGK
jgi:uncharacterized protein involved in tolerance to divalent cations